MILVIGGTGHVGRELVRELDARGAKTRLLVRDASRAGRHESVVGDLDRPDTLPAAFEGVERVFLLTPGTGLDHTRHALAAARAAGVSHIVHLSSFHVLVDPLPAMGRWHHAREELIRASGIPATFLRPGGFMTNALEWVPTIRSGGYVLDPSGPGRYAPIDPADIGAVAALALTEDGHAGQAYALTGAELVTAAEQIGILADVLGTELEVRPVNTADQAVAARFPRGGPQELMDAAAEWFPIMRADTVGYRTDTVQRLLGRAPGTFADWCARHADAFRKR
jgi:uncharacterized protein YbjT (DUF2867 family)